ncbi:endonuclease VII domain-containing protein [Actinoplanes hulinensis]|uniref:Endonuclease VII domain-containing protein n=1 Tax=Actinoplanes hulinensis TaxID=1144547 RepID=A0ABS7B8E5_9ACTN|nr:endonuclease VII domain-containing protein [Actinoplanes hulinensis]
MLGRLVVELGAQCHLCQQSPGAILDDDHFTGLIRGLLCIGCNNNLEECLHVTGWPPGRNDNYRSLTRPYPSSGG